MRAHMKKRLIEKNPVELRFLGPSIKRNEAVDMLKALGFVDISEAVPYCPCIYGKILLESEKFDYTKWQRNLWNGQRGTGGHPLKDGSP